MSMSLFKSCYEYHPEMLHHQVLLLRGRSYENDLTKCGLSSLYQKRQLQKVK